MRRLERAGGDDDLAAGADLLGLVALPVFDADRAFAFEQDTARLRIGFDPQIGTRGHVRMDIGPCRAPAFAVLLGDLRDAEAFMLLALEKRPAHRRTPSRYCRARPIDRSLFCGRGYRPWR